jgi:hypothetical protein
MLVEVALSNSGELQQRKKGEAEVILLLWGGLHHSSFAALLKPTPGGGMGRQTLSES